MALSQITLEISEDLQQKAEAQAAVEGHSLNDAIIKWLNEHLNEKPEQNFGFTDIKAKL